ncbi:MAG TPA: oligopeptide transporter, OPT family [Caulobacterales bacterium]|nr:oligopeptide transporter, OPT family [Caulobacterales bacterium]
MKASELTIRGLILGAIIAMVFTAANVYLGLFVAITVASSIPAAVISMGVLRALNTGTIRENNIVQTVASSGGTLSAIIFVLPGLVMIGYWQGFDYWTTFLICALGGTLGVLFSIPLRRALVVNTPLPFPEGVAAAEVLKVGATGDEASPDAIERRRGPLVVAFGAVTAALLKVLSFIGISAESLTKVFRIGAGATGVDIGFTLALAGAGHIVGISVGMAMLLGLLITWAGFVPMMTHGFSGDVGEAVTTTWRQVRLIGAGAIGIAAIWSLVKLVGPLLAGVNATLKARANGARAAGAHDDRDIPMPAIVLISLVCLAMIAWLIWNFIDGGELAPLALTLTLGGVIFAVVVGFFIAAVAGYMAGLIGASNSPVSGIGILATVSAAALLAVYAQPILGPNATHALVAFALFLVAVVFSVATISNDNLQDLKTGHLVGASPWKQQVALIVGVLAGSAVIPPVLDLLNRAYGFPGDPNRHAIAGEALPAPQAVLISTLAQGVLNAQLDWGLIGTGVVLGAALIVLDEVLGLMKLLRLPPLAVGLGIYLPMSATQPVVVGAIIGWFYNRAMEKRPNAEMAKRFGVLLASGLIVGESLFGILQAGLIVATNKEHPFVALPPSLADYTPWIGAVLFTLFLIVSYAWTNRQSKPS